jgi:hypothetical protein
MPGRWPYRHDGDPRRRLPAELEAHARTLNDIPEPPLDRRYWTVTPPIPGFDPEAAEAMVEAMNPPEL